MAIAACLWFISKKRHEMNGDRKRTGEVLFIDASELGYMTDRIHREFSDDDINTITNTYHEWRKSSGKYEDKKGFCKSATLKDIEAHDFVLTPGRYVGAAPLEEDGVPFEEKMRELSATLYAQMEESAKLDAEIKKNLEQLGYGE